MISEERLSKLSKGTPKSAHDLYGATNAPTESELQELVIAYRFFVQTQDLMQRNLEYYGAFTRKISS